MANEIRRTSSRGSQEKEKDFKKTGTVSCVKCPEVARKLVRELTIGFGDTEVTGDLDKSSQGSKGAEFVRLCEVGGKVGVGRERML